MNFTMTVKAIGDVAGRLTKLALDGELFDIALLEHTGDDWSFSSFVLRDCLITSATPTTATISGAPAATFSGFSLAASVDPKAGDPSDPAVTDRRSTGGSRWRTGAAVPPGSPVPGWPSCTRANWCCRRPGSEAEAEQVAEDDRAVIAYHFPVEIEVVAAGGAVDAERARRPRAGPAGRAPGRAGGMTVATSVHVPVRIRLDARSVTERPEAVTDALAAALARALERSRREVVEPRGGYLAALRRRRRVPVERRGAVTGAPGGRRAFEARLRRRIDDAVAAARLDPALPPG